jgi:hypothetical protein
MYAFYAKPTEDAHKYIMALKECLLNELQPGQGDTALTSQDQPFDIDLYASMETFWQLFNSERTRQTVTCGVCGSVNMLNVPFSKLILKFLEEHHAKSRQILSISLEDLLGHYSETQSNCQLNDYECNCCNMCTVATKHEDIIDYPSVLMIVLMCKKKDSCSINTKINFSLATRFV